jgi:PAS domain S-box-containing protein
VAPVSTGLSENELEGRLAELRRAEAALRATEQRFTRFMQHLPGLAWIKDHEGRYVFVNDAAEKAFRLPRAELYGRTDAEIFPSATAAQFQEHDRRARAEGHIQVVETLEHEDGELHHSLVSKFSIPGAADEPALVGGIAIDITQRRKFEQALHDTEERLRLALDAGNIGVWDWDIVHDKVTWSERIYEFHGMKPGEFGGACADFVKLVHPADAERVGQAIQAALEDGRPYSIEMRIVRPSGEVRWIGTSGRVLKDDAGRAVRMLGATLDITDRWVAEAALHEASRRKDEFLAMLAHELRNPLAPIRNAVQVLAMIGPDEGTFTQARDLIARQVSHLARLVDDLLDVSRITQRKILLRKERLDLAPLVRAAVEDHRALIEGGGVRLSADLPREPVMVSGDPTRLSQIVGNLMHNASKFTDAGGSVAVHLTVAGADDGTVPGAVPGAADNFAHGMAVLSVRDTGIGMEKEILARLFEPFSQADRSLARSRGGLGLGLALVKGLVELHDGRVEAVSAGLGRGSELIVRLPLQRQAPANSCGPVLAPANGSARVLVIEDNRDAAESLRMLLSLAGHQVAVAHAGQLGLDLARQTPPDIVLCDIGLPGGMDGYDVARALRKDLQLAAVQLIALSGYGQEEDQRRARQAGFDRHLTKPVDPVALLALLASLRN